MSNALRLSASEKNALVEIALLCQERGRCGEVPATTHNAWGYFHHIGLVETATRNTESFARLTQLGASSLVRR